MKVLNLCNAPHVFCISLGFDLMYLMVANTFKPSEMRQNLATTTVTPKIKKKVMKVIRNKTNTKTKHSNRRKTFPDISLNILSFCLKTTYFQFNDCLYRQVEGAAMGSPVSLIVANLFMKDFEQRALNSSPHPVNPNLPPPPVNFVPFGTMRYSPFDINLTSITCIKFVYLHFCLFLNKA